MLYVTLTLICIFNHLEKSIEMNLKKNETNLTKENKS